ncbi:zinc-dependent alcohol dehydrogenase [Mangrovihabitans endophyticus]|uniref:Zn-dependent alcohol dehydrogenase n=1 Tax=Mangrovihabitans endophyticus TaxID=1751298 RepID=A0A8J3FMS6_9ACTN|nr:zinc-binding dehydrogenase [Mangrovihabitans endophyticus]GGK81644.1 Zn-dependent alcohol dehydrogenase [Mangrovihabitans endophyticus]
MKALVKYAAADGAVEVRDVPVPEASPGAVLVRVHTVGVCGSDIHMWHNSQSKSSVGILPVTLGHESAGEIAAVGAGVEGWTVGDRVVCETAASICGRCALCRAGRYNLCPYRAGYGLKRDGAMAEFLVAEPRVLHRIPDGVSFEAAAMTEPFAVAFNAVVERAGVTPGDLVVIQGAGAIGILALQVAILQGAATTVVLGTDIDAGRLATARTLGADHVLNVQRDDPADLVRTLHDGLGADLVVDATGVSVALQTGMQLVRPAGSIAKVGWGPQPLGFTIDPLVKKAVTLYGCYSHTWNTWERVLRLFADGRLHPERVLGGRYPIEDWQEAFTAMQEGRNVKSALSLRGETR